MKKTSKRLIAISEALNAAEQAQLLRPADFKIRNLSKSICLSLNSRK